MRLLPGSYCWTKLLSQREVRWKWWGVGGGGGRCEGTILTCQNNCLCFLCVDPSGATYTDPLYATSSPWHDGFC